MIKNIIIKNFKSIKEATTDLPQVVGAIVGANGVGKTNLIQAINFVRNLAVGENTSEALKKIALTAEELMNYNEISSKEIYFGFTLHNLSDKKYFLEVVLNLVNDSTNIKAYTIKSEALYKITENNQKEIIFIREGTILQDKNNAAIPLAVENDKLAIASYQQEDVFVVKNIFINTVIPEQDSIDFRESMVKSDSKGLAGVIIRLSRKDQQAYSDFLKIVKYLLPTFSTIIEKAATQPTDAPPETEVPYMVLLQEENLKGNLSMKLLSAGDLRTLYIIATAMNLAPGATFIIEEIENGLHPKRLTDLLQHLTHIAHKKDLQILYSTHSPVVINKLEPECIIFVKKESPGGTKLHLLSETAHIDNIKKLLIEGMEITDYMYSRMQ